MCTESEWDDSDRAHPEIINPRLEAITGLHNISMLEKRLLNTPPKDTYWKPAERYKA